MTKSAFDRLRTRSEALGATESQQALLVSYVKLLCDHGKRANLVGTTDAARIIDELVLDSLELLPMLDETERHLVDVGSGAGIPGLPLVCALAGSTATLIEPRRKRAMFLKHAARTLGVRDRVDVIEGRWEGDPIDTKKGRPVLWVSRAVLEPAEWVARVSVIRSSGDVIAVWTNGEAADVELSAEARATREYQFGPGRTRTIRLV